MDKALRDELGVLELAEVRELLKISTPMLKRLFDSGQLQFVMVGKRRKVTRAELRRYLGVDSLDALEQESAPEEEPAAPAVTAPADALARFADRWRLNLIKR